MGNIKSENISTENNSENRSESNISKVSDIPNITTKDHNDGLRFQDSPMSRFSKHIQKILSTSRETLNKDDAYNIIHQYFSLANSNYDYCEQNRKRYVHFLENITTLINQSRELCLRKAQMIIDIHLREKELQNFSNTFNIFSQAEDLYRQLDGMYSNHIEISPFNRSIYNMAMSPLFNNQVLSNNSSRVISLNSNNNFAIPSTFTFSDYINKSKGISKN
jgi:hypothetical protein